MLERTKLLKDTALLTPIAVFAYFKVFSQSWLNIEGSFLSHVITSAYLSYVGLLFLLAYYYEEKSYVFKGLIWVCLHFSSPKSRKMAFFYFALPIVLSIGFLIQEATEM